MKKIILLLLIGACSSTGICQEFNTQKLLDNLKEFSSDAFEGRSPSQDGGKKSRNFVRSQFEELKLASVNDSYFQEFPLENREGEKFIGYNVMGVIKGTEFPEKYMVVSSHHDHMGIRDGEIYNGADDNGSGTCALFALAEYFQKNNPKHSILFVAFDAEEWGLRGSRAFVSDPPIALENILINMNMDMIGRNVNNEIYVTGTNHYPQLKDLFDGISSELKVSFGHDGTDGKQDWSSSSDHGPFHQKGIPFLYFGEEDHPDYHKPTDTFAGIQPAFYVQAVELVLQTIRVFDQK